MFENLFGFGTPKMACIRDNPFMALMKILQKLSALREGYINKNSPKMYSSVEL